MTLKEIAVCLGIFSAFSGLVTLAASLPPNIEFWFGWTSGGKVSYVLLHATALLTVFGLFKGLK